MSVDLDIGALAAAAREASSAADAYDSQASRASGAASALGLAWEGGGYAAFSSLVEGSAVPCARIAAGACRSLAGALDDARRRASRLRSRAEGFPSILSGAGEPACEEGSESGRLYSDDACFDPIDADLANAEEAIAAARSAFWEAEGLLWGLRTRGVAMDGGGFASALAETSSRLAAFRSSFSSYRAEMGELEAASAQASSSLSCAFHPSSASAVYEGGAVKDPAALAWLLARPYAFLSEEERGIADALRAEGLSMPRLYEEGLAKEGLSGVVRGPGDEEGLVGSLLSAAGYAVGAHEAALDVSYALGEGMMDPAGRALVKGAAGALKGASVVLNFASASYASGQYYENHPELPEDRRASNQAAEWDLKLVQGFAGVIPPLEEIYVQWVYVDTWGTNMTPAEWFYEWRYEALGRHGW